MKKNVVFTLLFGIGILVFIKILSKTPLYFTDTQAIAFINYLKQKDNFIGVSNFAIWFFTICAIVVTYLNKVDKERKADKK